MVIVLIRRLEDYMVQLSCSVGAEKQLLGKSRVLNHLHGKQCECIQNRVGHMNNEFIPCVGFIRQ